MLRSGIREIPNTLERRDRASLGEFELFLCGDALEALLDCKDKECEDGWKVSPGTERPGAASVCWCRPSDITHSTNSGDTNPIPVHSTIARLLIDTTQVNIGHTNSQVCLTLTIIRYKKCPVVVVVG